MALKVLMLRKKLEEKRTELEELRRQAEDFQRREAELEKDIDEARSDEEKQAVEEAVEQYDRDKDANEKAATALEGEIKEIETEVEALERKKPAPTGGQERKGEVQMETRAFFGMTMERRDAFLAREDVKDFLVRVRELAGQKRAINGSELLIPEVMLGLIREQVQGYSKLYKYVNVRPVPGKARQNIMGTIPEGIWTEMCASLNELSLTFNNVEVDGYKVGGFIAVCNATLEDSDIALASELITALGQAIGYALDKAVLYGKGVKMPLGVMTRLAQTAKPSDYSATARPWADLHTSNLVTISGKSGVDLFKALVLASGKAKGKFSRGAKFWAMSETTKTMLQAEAVTFNAAGAVVSAQNGTMPIVGGDIVELDFIPDGDVVGGYGDLYLLAERAGAAIGQSEHARFVEDQTIFKGTARYDGLPAIPEGFVGLNISGKAPTTSVDFAGQTEPVAPANSGK